MKLLHRPIPLTLRMAIGLILIGFGVLGSFFYTLESRTVNKGYSESQATAESLLAKVKEANASTPATSSPSQADEHTNHAKEAPKGIIKLSTATQAELETLPGIGPVKAKAIIDYRISKGFKSVNDLQKVKGIGPKTVEKLKPLVEI